MDTEKNEFIKIDNNNDNNEKKLNGSNAIMIVGFSRRHRDILSHGELWVWPILTVDRLMLMKILN